MSTEALNSRLLQQVLAAAEAQGLDQVRLAELSGLKPETISRAKKRRDMELGTLARLAAVVGLEVTLQATSKVGEDELWEFKRRRQRADLASVAAGRTSQDQLSWFSGGRARSLKIFDSPY